jgi:hypothetical protein
VQEYYDESLHVFEIVEEIKLHLQKRPTAEDAIDQAHADVLADESRYRELVRVQNGKSGKKTPEEFSQAWQLVIATADVKAAAAGKEAWPRQYICPITRKVMENPVLSPTTGQYYEQRALQTLIDSGGAKIVCPLTGKEFDRAVDRDLDVDVVMKRRILDFRTRNQ